MLKQVRQKNKPQKTVIVTSYTMCAHSAQTLSLASKVNYIILVSLKDDDTWKNLRKP